MLAQRARDNVAAVVFCNLVGGQDELVFDGHCVAIDQDGEIVARAPQFEEAFTVVHARPRRGRSRAACSDARHRDAVHAERVRGARRSRRSPDGRAPVREPVASAARAGRSPRGGEMGGPIAR